MGDTEDGVKPKRTVFVTVGTTCFDALVRAVDTWEVKDELLKRGYTHLTIQMGRGSDTPTKSGGEGGSLAVDFFTFSSSIADHLRAASLVISHAGIEFHLKGHQFKFFLRKIPVIWTISTPWPFKTASISSGWGGGSGSIFETLRLGKPLIVVVNEDLMDNHQSELAEELAERKHLYCARPQTLNQTIASMNLESLLPYHPGDATPVAKLINRFLGFPDD
ncbi:uncharacterized protein LOC133883149 isoform X1 [Alnus glutinosa]|uniref:uncharacterized protein LOC133883149 isoform X1 n=1 Tax=Alnus glutinosa TaxID=3517 RepID=UPI002D79C7D4|nr:uncharacterized protein LOC133883149 isoform X1 [Alnus glutinosa]XP_062178353.1 uncharacterized protein LOC133883149 isoform X1 [Alnus glutinosa]